MIGLTYNVRVSLRESYLPLHKLFDSENQQGVTTSTSMLERILGKSQANATPPIVEYGLSLDELDRRIVTPFEQSRIIILDGRDIPFGGMERVEIRAEGSDSNLSPIRDRLLDSIRRFEYSGTDVTREFIKNLPTWGPNLGAPERPEDIPVDLLFDRLVTNESLRKATRDRFRSRNFADAVETAFKCVANAVKDKASQHDRDGVSLMRHVFSDNSPLLALNALQSQSDKDEQSGYRDIFAGVMTGIRNPRAHEHEIKDNPAAALELLAMANHLMRKLETATRVCNLM